MNLTFNGIWRMDWGFGNPNLTAAFLICLFCVVWLPAYIWRHGFWVSLPFSTAIGVCIIHTLSRGGILGALIAVCVLVAFAPRPWMMRRLIACGCAVWVAIAAAFLLSAHERIGQGIIREDKSITHRLEIWKVAPQMLATRPSGWGWNNAGVAHSDWFQPVERTENYGSLVNTHLTKVVELGLVGGSVYLFVWLCAFLLSWPSSHSRWRAVLLALLVGFAGSATFTNMAREWMLWILPGIALLAALVGRIFNREVISPRWLLGAALVSFIFTGALYLAGTHQKSVPLTFKKDHTVYGHGTPGLWIVADESSPGPNYRRKLREFLVTRSDLTVGFTEDPDALPEKLNAPLLVISQITQEQAERLYKKAKSVLFVTPSFPPPAAFNDKIVRAVFGEFGNSSQLSGWSAARRAIILPGIGDFIPNWPTLVVLAEKQAKNKQRSAADMKNQLAHGSWVLQLSP